MIGESIPFIAGVSMSSLTRQLTVSVVDRETREIPGKGHPTFLEGLMKEPKRDDMHLCR
jgi:hypothetical protein